MITFKHERSDDFEDEIRRIFEKKLADAVRSAGIRDVEVSVDKDHNITLSGAEEAVSKAREVVGKLR